MYDPNRNSLIIAYEHLIPYESYVAWYKGYTPDLVSSSSLVSKDWKLRQQLLEDFAIARDSNVRLYERLQRLGISENLRICQPTGNKSEQDSQCEVQVQDQEESCSSRWGDRSSLFPRRIATYASGEKTNLRKSTDGYAIRHVALMSSGCMSISESGKISSTSVCRQKEILHTPQPLQLPVYRLDRE